MNDVFFFSGRLLWFTLASMRSKHQTLYLLSFLFDSRASSMHGILQKKSLYWEGIIGVFVQNCSLKKNSLQFWILTGGFTGKSLPKH